MLKWKTLYSLIRRFFSCYAITEGGARKIDDQKRTIVLSCMVEKTAKKVVSLCIKLNIEFNICIEGKSYLYPYEKRRKFKD